MTTKAKRTIAIIMVILALAVGSIELLRISGIVIKTGADLIALYDSACFYNEQIRKTDAMTEDYIENQKLREQIYNSEDIIVRTYSNLWTLLKIAGLFLAFASYPLVLYMWLWIGYQFKLMIEDHRKERKKSR